MRKNIIREVIVHIADDGNIHTLTDRVNEFHVDMIERKLNQSDLATEQKIAVIDLILADLQAREVNGFIK